MRRFLSTKRAVSVDRRRFLLALSTKSGFFMDRNQFLVTGVDFREFFFEDCPELLRFCVISAEFPRIIV